LIKIYWFLHNLTNQTKSLATTMTAVTTAATMAAIVVVAATVTGTAVGGKDNIGYSHGRGHRQQSIKLAVKTWLGWQQQWKQQPRAQQWLLRARQQLPQVLVQTELPLSLPRAQKWLLQGQQHLLQAWQGLTGASGG
jgi:hypothetical protein